MNKHYRKTRYQRGSPGKAFKIAVWDLETKGLGGMVNFATWQTEDMTSAQIIEGTERHIMSTLWQIMCDNTDYIWFAHYAQYDMRYLVEYMEAYHDDMEIFLRTDNDCYMITVTLDEKKTLTIRDSYSLVMEPLRAFTQAMCPELPKLSIDFEREDFDPTNEFHRAYAIRDAESLMLALRRFDDLLFQSFGIHARCTAGSSAVAAWERTLAKGEYYTNPVHVEAFVRQAYYGGIVFMTTTNEQRDVNTYDINSSYPYQMLTHDYPIGSPIRTIRYEQGKPGIYNVIVKTPENLIVPILPVRGKNGIQWGTGTFETTVTNAEIDFAIQHGYEILTIKEGIVWDETARPFKTFIEKCRDIRFANKRNALDLIAKRLQNSFYGKHAAKRIRRKVYATLPENEIFGCDMWGSFYVRDEVADDMMCLPQWSVFTTAYARLHLLKEVYAIGPENVIYGDTDSITVKQGFAPSNVGREYGAWKLEKEWSRFKAGAPKVYAGVLHNGVIKGAAKGLPRKTWERSGIMEAILTGDRNVSVQYQTLPSFMVGLRDGFGEATLASRKVSDLANSISWMEQSNGDVRPRAIAP